MKRLFRRRGQRGLTLIEMAAASVIIAVSIVAFVSTWLYSFRIMQTTDEVAVAQNLARTSIERIRARGFLYADASNIAQWYDANMAPTSQSSAYYQLVVAIRNEDTEARGYPSSWQYMGLREIEVTVSRVSDSVTLYQTQAYMTIGGI